MRLASACSSPPKADLDYRREQGRTHRLARRARRPVLDDRNRAKAAKICKLYVSPPPGTTVLCIDEKPGFQALRRTRAARPLRPGKPARLEFEYEHKGTRNVFAAFNVKNGHVLHPHRGCRHRLAEAGTESCADRSSGRTQAACFMPDSQMCRDFWDAALVHLGYARFTRRAEAFESRLGMFS